MEIHPDQIQKQVISSPPKEHGEAQYIARYLTLPKYCLLVMKSILSIPNVVNFSDTHECRYPDPQFRWLLSDGSVRETVGQEFFDHLNRVNSEAKEYFASCWYDSTNGSPNETMWSAYAGDGVFVVFEKKSFMDALISQSYRPYRRTEREIVAPFGFGPVRYYGQVDFADWLSEDKNLPHPAFAKRRAYQPENEFRIVYRRRDFSDDVRNGLRQPKGGFGLHFQEHIENYGLLRVVYKSTSIKNALLAIRETLEDFCGRKLPKEMDWEKAAAFGIGEADPRCF